MYVYTYIYIYIYIYVTTYVYIYIYMYKENAQTNPPGARWAARMLGVDYHADPCVSIRRDIRWEEEMLQLLSSIYVRRGNKPKAKHNPL